MHRRTFLITAVFSLYLLSLENEVSAQRKPAPPPSRYTYTLEFDRESLPEGVTIRTVDDELGTRYFIKNTSEKPLVIKEVFQNDQLVGGAKLMNGQVYHYFPNGVPMEGKQHLKGWQAPFGVIPETILTLPQEPAKIYEGRKPGLSEELPKPEQVKIPATYDGEPHPIKATIHYHLNPTYDPAQP